MESAEICLIREYDYLIVGGGAAGLSLAYHIAREPRLAGKKVLLIEPAAKDQNDRTWSFWADEPTAFDGIVAHEWRKIAFRSPGFERVFDLGCYRYKTINGLDYYRFVRRALADKPAVYGCARSRERAGKYPNRRARATTRRRRIHWPATPSIAARRTWLKLKQPHEIPLLVAALRRLGN